MLIKFKAKTMPIYAGADGLGGSIKLSADDVAEVADSTAKLLMQKYGSNFEVVIVEKPAHAPDADKLYRKSPKVKTK